MAKTGKNVPAPEKKSFKVPKGLKTLLEEMACEIFRFQPDNILKFLADYLDSKLSGKPLNYEPKVTVELPPGPEGALIEAKRNKSILAAVASFDFSKNCVCEAKAEFADTLGSTPAVPYENLAKPSENLKSSSDKQTGKKMGEKHHPYIPNEAVIEKQRASIGISKVEFGKGIPPNLSQSKVALFEKIDTAILQGLELVDYLEKAVESYKANPPVKSGKMNKGTTETFRNRPSRVEIADHVDVALGNAFKLRDGLDEILREHSGDGPEARKSELEQRALLKKRQNGSVPVESTSTVVFLKRQSQSEVSEALVARVDKLNAVVGRALTLVEELDKMDIPEGDEVQYLMEYGGAAMGEGSRPESQSQMHGRSMLGKPAEVDEDLTPAQAALLQKAANDTVDILMGGGELTPSQVQLLQSRGLLTPSQAQILLAGGSLTPSQLKVIEERNMAEAQAAADNEAATQKVVDFALDVLQNGGTLTPSQVQLLADRDLLSPSKAQILTAGGALSPSQIRAIVAKNAEAEEEKEDKEKPVFAALDKLHHGYKLSMSEVQLLKDRNLITPSKAELLANGGTLSPSQLQGIGGESNPDPAPNEEAMAQATQEAIFVLQAGGTLSPSQIALLADRDLISASKAQFLNNGGTLTPSQIQVIALDAAQPIGEGDVPTPAEVAVKPVESKAKAPSVVASRTAQISPSQARLEKENDALELIRNGGHPTHSQIEILASSGKITGDQAKTLAGGGSVDLDAQETAPASSPSRAVVALETVRGELVEAAGFTQRQLQIMRGLLTGKISVSEAPVQAGILLAIFAMGVVVGYQVIRKAHRRMTNASFAETVDQVAEGETFQIKKCTL